MWKFFKLIYPMKKTLSKSGAPTNKNGIDYIKKFREAPPHLIKRITHADFVKQVEQARAEKLKKAS
jgi:hypothetical protein